MFSGSRLVSRLKSHDYLTSEFQLPGLSYVEAANFGAVVLESQRIYLDSTSQLDMPYLERLYSSVDRFPGGIEWLLSSARPEPGFFAGRLYDLQHSEIKVNPWPRISELYTQLYEMESNGEPFVRMCLLAYASFSARCPSGIGRNIYLGLSNMNVDSSRQSKSTNTQLTANGPSFERMDG